MVGKEIKEVEHRLLLLVGLVACFFLGVDAIKRVSFLLGLGILLVIAFTAQWAFTVWFKKEKESFRNSDDKS